MTVRARLALLAYKDPVQLAVISSKVKATDSIERAFFAATLPFAARASHCSVFATMFRYP